MAKLTRGEEMAQPVYLLTPIAGLEDEPRQALISLRELATTDSGILAARQKRTITRFVEATPGAARVVLTGGEITYNINPNFLVMVTKLLFGITTISDDCYFELGYTDGENGGGNFTAQTARFFLRTGNAPEGRTTYSHDFYPPIPIGYGAGARSVACRVEANDAACSITLGWYGWFEEEEP